MPPAKRSQSRKPERAVPSRWPMYLYGDLSRAKQVRACGLNSTSNVTVPPLPFLKVKGMKGGPVLAKWSSVDPLVVRLTDGQNFLWAYCTPNGYTAFEHWTDSKPGRIMAALAKLFGVRFVAEYSGNDGDDGESDYDESAEARKALEQSSDLEGNRHFKAGLALRSLMGTDERPRFLKSIAEWLLQGQGVADEVLAVVRAEKQAVRELGQAIADLADQPAEPAKSKRHRKGKSAG